MAKITRRQLKQIIQEEIENTAIDEGFVDTFKMLGGDLKKWYKSAEQRGDVNASERASDKVIQATIQTLEDNLNKLRSKYGMEGEKGTEAIRQRMGELKIQIATLGNKGEAADDVIDAIADASDGNLELPNVIQMAKDLSKKADALPKAGSEGAAEGGEKATKLSTGDKIVDDPQKTAQIVIAAIKRAGPKKSLTKLFTGEDPKFDERFLAVLQNVMKLAAAGDKTGKIFGTANAAPEAEQKAVAENKQSKLQISRAALQEAIKLMQEYGL